MKHIDWGNVQEATDYKPLPAEAYICGILRAEDACRRGRFGVSRPARGRVLQTVYPKGGMIQMTKYEVSSGPVAAPVKVVLYGVEGIGKSTFASKFPHAVFIDTEGSTKRLDVRRLPAPTSWTMLLDEVETVRTGGVPDCGTLIIDTADWAERLCINAVCTKYKVQGIEDFGYGKGYTYTKEEFAHLLDKLDGVAETGRNIVVTAHAIITSFDQPDAAGSYSRWAMKTSKQVAPLLREWCDMLLFANYKTIVEKAGTGPNAKNKASGAKRVLYTTHNACWDAKNRFGLPEELPFEYEAIAACVPVAAPKAAASAPRAAAHKAPAKRPRDTEADILPTPAAEPAAKPDTLPAPEQQTFAQQIADGQQAINKELFDEGVPAALRGLMAANNVDSAMLRHAVYQRGCYPEDTPIKNYDPQFVEGQLVAKWDKWHEFIKANADIPF